MREFLCEEIASEPRFPLRKKWVKMALAAEFPPIPSSAVKNRQRTAMRDFGALR